MQRRNPDDHNPLLGQWCCTLCRRTFGRHQLRWWCPYCKTLDGAGASPVSKADDPTDRHVTN